MYVARATWTAQQCYLGTLVVQATATATAAAGQQEVQVDLARRGRVVVQLREHARQQQHRNDARAVVAFGR